MGGKQPKDYNSSCINSTMCNLGSTYNLFHQAGGVDALDQHCHEKAILTAADAMWQASWLAGCSYLWDASARITEASGPCDKAGDGFIYIFSTIAYAGTHYLIILLVSYLGMHAWDKNNYAESVQQ